METRNFEEDSIQVTQLQDGADTVAQHLMSQHDEKTNEIDLGLSDSLNDLTSEVPETAQLLNEIPPHIHVNEDLNNRPHDANTHSLPETSDSTQPISQSFYTTIIRKSKSRILPEDEDEDEDKSAETQRTLNEGDHGHVDITSSFVTGKSDEDEDHQGSEIADFSPTQSQHQLTQFPESERFKTPATIGRKRNYDGQFVESPLLPRNPLRGDAPTPANLVGLSQVFAGTQAASSPFSNGLPTGPRSDRPSPNVELQIKAATADDSSPLRPISAFKRALTEPASRYVSVKQSQAVRDREVHTTDDQDREDDDDDSFDGQSSEYHRSKRTKASKERINAQLQRLSSPLLADINEIKPNNVTDNASQNLHVQAMSGSDVDPNEDGAAGTNYPESEAETEQDDEDGVEKAQHQTSDFDGEDKENQLVNVPRTVISSRLHNYINGSITEIDASPLARQFVHPSQMVTMHSSAFQDVPNSQPGEERRKPPEYQGPSESSGERVTAEVLLTRRVDTGKNDVKHKADRDNGRDVNSGQTALTAQTSRNSKVGKLPPGSDVGVNISNTVPETSSDVRQGRNDSTKSVTDDTHSTTNTTRYATAPTINNHTSDEMSSQPVSKTPPATRRRRLIDISAEPSPMKSTPSFNAREALQLDEDKEAAQLLSETPRRAKAIATSITLAEASSQSVHSVSDKDQQNELEPHLGNDIESSQNIIPPMPQRHSARARTQLPGSNKEPEPRSSIWDIGESPVKPTPKANERKKMPRVAKHISRIEDRLNPKLASVSSTAPTFSNETAKSSTGTHNEDIAGSNDHDEEITAPNMVFACFNGKIRAYYPAICLGLASSDARRYQIQWEGYDPDEVDSHGVTRLDLRVGDAIKINLATYPKVPYIVRGFKDKVENLGSEITDVRGYRTLIVTPKQRKSLPSGIEPTSQMEVGIKTIYLDNNMWGQMKNRHFQYIPSKFVDVSEGVSTPLDRAVTPSTPSSRRRHQILPAASGRNPKGDGLFTNLAFAVSYDDSHRKNSLVSLIQEQNGVILPNSFSELLKPDTIEVQDQFAHLGFTVLLTEAYSRKEKYMQALALGLPCLSGAWVEACLKRQSLVDWRTYLLPAGESTELDGAVRSRIMMSVQPTEVKLLDMIEQRFRPLEGASVIAVVGRGKSEAKWAKYVLLIRALGATRIDKVADAKAAHALHDSLAVYSWVFVDDKDVSTTRDLFRGKPAGSRRSKVTISREPPTHCTVAGQELIVQSLILGQLSTSELA